MVGKEVDWYGYLSMRDEESESRPFIYPYRYVSKAISYVNLQLLVTSLSFIIVPAVLAEQLDFWHREYRVLAQILQSTFSFSLLYIEI